MEGIEKRFRLVDLAIPSPGTDPNSVRRFPVQTLPAIVLMLWAGRRSSDFSDFLPLHP
jgi:hypothetical protein